MSKVTNVDAFDDYISWSHGANIPHQYLLRQASPEIRPAYFGPTLLFFLPLDLQPKRLDASSQLPIIYFDQLRTHVQATFCVSGRPRDNDFGRSLTT